jgi:hydrogenase maturation protein HypF
MVRDVTAAAALCEMLPEDEAVLRHLRRPVVLLPRRPGPDLVPGVAPGNSNLGLMLPYTPLHYLLFSDSPQTDSVFPALVMTSGNISAEPIVISNADAMLQLNSIADWFLLHNREIATRVDDSVVRTFEGRERVLRRSRGFVPQTIPIETADKPVLAYGAELKSTFCLTKDGHAILSQHIGDLQNYETMQFFEETLSKMKRLFRVTPQAVAYDLHPHYMSTRMAIAADVERKVAVQHHHAHIASCMAENHLSGDVIGVAFDGTGYGLDGKIWGGEFLTVNTVGFIRRAHFRYVPLPGGDMAVRQPWRMALSYFRDALGGQVSLNLPCFRDLSLHQVSIVDSMLSRSLNTVETSSCGRLFDAVAALTGLASEVTFEGQAAIALEVIATHSDQQYEFDIEDGEPAIIDFRAMIAAIVRDISKGTAAGEISSRFHNTLSFAIVEICTRIRELIGLNRVCLSGGSFQNAYLLHRTVQNLRTRGFGVFLHSVVPANDGGIALGQAVITNALLRRGE